MTTSREARRIQPWSIWLVIGIMLGGIVVSFNYLKRNKAEAYSARPPFAGKLERNLTLRNREGEAVELARLKGKIWVGSYLYTGSPQRAPAVARKLRTIWEEFGDDPRFHLVTFSLDPEGDTAAKRSAFLANHGADHPRWWFLTAPREKVEGYVTRYLRMMPTRPASTPEEEASWGPWKHDLRVVLIDGKANVRGFYQLLHPDRSEENLERLRRDIRYLLEQEEATPTGITPRATGGTARAK